MFMATNNQPRINPKLQSSWNEKDHDIMKPFVKDNSVMNIFTTLLNHQALFKRWLVFANHILFKSSLPSKEKEIAILRIGFLCKCEYEWAQHVVIARRVGLDDAIIEEIKKGEDSTKLSELQRLIIRSVNELYEYASITDKTWSSLEKYFSTEQLMDLVFTVGQYNLVSMALNSFKVQIDRRVASQVNVDFTK
tara:strand:- start:57 stop:635 length:579 start_codon:yes stop_codon:yes gene_type:complete